MRIACGILLVSLVLPGWTEVVAEGPGQGACRVVQRGDQVELHSPFFLFRLDTSAGLRARSWENRLTGREISLGNVTELELDLDAAEQRIGISGWSAR